MLTQYAMPLSTFPEYLIVQRAATFYCSGLHLRSKSRAPGVPWEEPYSGNEAYLGQTP